MAISDKDEVCRFIFQDQHCNPNTKKLHWRAFEPRPNEQTGRKEVSIFIVSSLSDEDINKIGSGHVASLQNREFKSKVVFLADIPMKIELSLEMEASTHELHANIVGWPNAENDELQKSQELAQQVKQHLSTRITKPT